MYIEKYWENYIGGTDDSMTLLEYLAGKEETELSLGEIISDSGLDKLESFRETDGGLSLPVEGFDAEIQYAIDLVTDLAALLLECRESGSIDLSELSDMCDEGTKLCINASPEEMTMIDKAIADFIAEPTAYDIAEMLSEEELSEMAEICGELYRELFA